MAQVPQAIKQNNTLSGLNDEPWLEIHCGHLQNILVLPLEFDDKYRVSVSP